MKRFIVVIALLAALVVPAKAQYSLEVEKVASELHVAGYNRYFSRTLARLNADSATVVLRVADSTAAFVQLVPMSPDGVTQLASNVVIPIITATNAPQYTTATIRVQSAQNYSALVVNARSTRSTTAGINADGVKAWIYLHKNP